MRVCAIHIPLANGGRRFPQNRRNPRLTEHMRKLLVPSLAVSTLLLTILLLGCSAVQQRGVAGNAYVSTSRPAVAVHVKDMPLVTSGRGTGRLYRPNMAAVPVNVRTAVFGTKASAPMAIVTHAELPNDFWIWTSVYPRPRSSKLTTEVIGGQPFAAFTYLVPCKNDPYAGLVGDPTQIVKEGYKDGDDPAPAYWLARYLAIRTNFNHDKIILEYREPAPRGLETMESIPFGMTDQIREFEERARKAFTLGLPDPKLGPIQDGFPQGVRWQFMSDPYLGDVLFQEPLDRF